MFYVINLDAMLSDLGRDTAYCMLLLWLLLNFVFGMVLKVRKDDGGGPEL